MSLKSARELRKNATDCERLLWLHLRAGRLQGFKFKRQQPLGNYIVDFVCFQTRLIVEADGGQHNEQIEYDTHRDDWLRSQGFNVLRFWNNDILTNTEGVLAVILDACSQYVDTPSPHPLSREGRGAKGAGYIQDQGADSALADLMPAANSVGFNNRPINTEKPNSPRPSRDDCMDIGGRATSGTVAERTLAEFGDGDRRHNTPLPSRERGRGRGGDGL